MKIRANMRAVSIMAPRCFFVSTTLIPRIRFIEAIDRQRSNRRERYQQPDSDDAWIRQRSIAQHVRRRCPDHLQMRTWGIRLQPGGRGRDRRLTQSRFAAHLYDRLRDPGGTGGDRLPKEAGTSGWRAGHAGLAGADGYGDDGAGGAKQRVCGHHQVAAVDRPVAAGERTTDRHSGPLRRPGEGRPVADGDRSRGSSGPRSTRCAQPSCRRRRWTTTTRLRWSGSKSCLRRG